MLYHFGDLFRDGKHVGSCGDVDDEARTLRLHNIDTPLEVILVSNPPVELELRAQTMDERPFAPAPPPAKFEARIQLGLPPGLGVGDDIMGRDDLPFTILS